MSKFIEVTEKDGKRIFINVAHIFKIEPQEWGCTVYFIVPLDYKCHFVHLSNDCVDVFSLASLDHSLTATS